MTQTRQNWFRNLTIASTVKYYPSNFIMDSKFLSNKTHEVKFLKQIKFCDTVCLFSSVCLHLCTKTSNLLSMTMVTYRLPVLAAPRGIIGVTTDSCSSCQFCWNRSSKSSSLLAGVSTCNKITFNVIAPFPK